MFMIINICAIMRQQESCFESSNTYRNLHVIKNELIEQINIDISMNLPMTNSLIQEVAVSNTQDSTLSIVLLYDMLCIIMNLSCQHMFSYTSIAIYNIILGITREKCAHADLSLLTRLLQAMYLLHNRSTGQKRSKIGRAHV